MIRPVNVLHLIESLEVGGAENVAVDIINHLSPRFHSTVCCLQQAGPVAVKLRGANVGLVVLGKKEGNDFSVPFRLADVLHQRRIDVLHSHGWGTFCEGASAALLADTPVHVHMAHGMLQPYPENDPFKGVKRFVRRRVEWLLSHEVDKIVAVSDSVRKEIVEEMGLSAGKVTVIRNGVSFPEAADGDRERRRSEAGIAPGDKVLCGVGRLAEVKNYRWLIGLFPEIERRFGAPVKLILVGDGPERPRLESEVDRLRLRGRVVLLGERRDVGEWLSLSDAFVLPSLHEGVSLALLEAMVMALPAVATRVGGTPEVVINGETGLLTESGDAEGFIGAVVSLLRDAPLRARLGRAGRDLVRSEYDVREVVKKYEALYLSEARNGFPLVEN